MKKQILLYCLVILLGLQFFACESVKQPISALPKVIATVDLPPLFADNMVLQQQEKVAFWGTATPNGAITVAGSWGQEANVIADAAGNWQLRLATPKAGGPYQVTVNNTTFKDVMIGEVWLASGQSNMEMPLAGWPPNDPIANSAEEIAAATYPSIRMFTVVKRYSAQKETELEGAWAVCTPETADKFSASAYFFARRLHQELNIPIGIIHASWGGTVVEAWTSRERLGELGDFEETFATIEDPANEHKTKNWYSQCSVVDLPSTDTDWNTLDLKDASLAQSIYDDQSWATINLPTRFDKFDNWEMDGVVWLRKTFDLAGDPTDYMLTLGSVDDMDVTYINGEKIGAMVGSGKYNKKRVYPIPANLLQKGKNTIAIQAIDTGGPGVITGEMILSNGRTADISLVGSWKISPTAEIYQNKFYTYNLQTINIDQRPNILQITPNTPSVLYNAMIHPLLPYTLKGAIWYQGESNVGRAMQYGRLFPTMIANWRSDWGTDFPFYYVQIAPYRYQNSGDPTQDKSQELREAQRHTLQVPKTGMVVTMDIGNYTNIHPANKQDVGSRLAGLALANDYGQAIVASGPLYKSKEIIGNKLVIEFDHIGTGLMAKNKKLTGFEIAGAYGRFRPATARIIDNKVEVSAASLEKPVYARYAWLDNGLASLFNKEGLPASSFVTAAAGPKRFASEIARMKDISYDPQKDRVVFTGSSSVRMWKDVQTYYPAHQIINTGFGGSQMSDLLYYLEETIFRFSPTKVFIYEGDNDIAAKEPLGTILANTKKVVEAIEKRLPNCEIILIAAKPSLARWELKPAYEKLNTRFEAYAAQKSNRHYANVWEVMLDEKGDVFSSIFISDGLHMNKEGYQLWDKVIAPFLE